MVNANLVFDQSTPVTLDDIKINPVMSFSAMDYEDMHFCGEHMMNDIDLRHIIISTFNFLFNDHGKLLWPYNYGSLLQQNHYLNGLLPPLYLTVGQIIDVIQTQGWNYTMHLNEAATTLFFSISKNVI
jgi:hypothetical protein